MRKSWLLVTAWAVAMPGVARADWYFSTLDGTQIGPYSTYDQCQSARYQNDAWKSSNLCVEIGGGLHPSGTSPAGIVRFWGAGTFGAVSDGNALAAHGGAGGIELARGALPGRRLYMFTDVFGADQYVVGNDGKHTELGAFGLVLGPELASGYGRVSAFIQLGAGFIIESGGSSTDYFGVQGAAGVDFSVSPRLGILAYGLGIATPSLPGTMLAGVALELRGPKLVSLRQ